jgi:hypothetical protein
MGMKCDMVWRCDDIDRSRGIIEERKGRRRHQLDWRTRYSTHSLYRVYMCIECPNETLGTIFQDVLSVLFFVRSGYREHSIQYSPECFLYRVSPCHASYTKILMYRVSLYTECVGLPHSVQYCTETKHSIEIDVTVTLLRLPYAKDRTTVTPLPVIISRKLPRSRRSITCCNSFALGCKVWCCEPYAPC